MEIEQVSWESTEDINPKSRERTLSAIELERLVRKMESSKQFKQTKIDSERFATENSSTTDRVQFDINALYIPSTDKAETSGGMN